MKGISSFSESDFSLLPMQIRSKSDEANELGMEKKSEQWLAYLPFNASPLSP